MIRPHPRGIEIVYAESRPDTSVNFCDLTVNANLHEEEGAIGKSEKEKNRSFGK